MYATLLAAVILSLCCSPSIAAGDRALPEYMHICHKSDPDLMNCIVKSIETLRPYLVKGIPELEIPQIEPIDIGNLLIADRTSENGLSVSALDIRAFGAKDFIVRKLNIVDYARLYTFELKLPALYVEGRYTLDGRIILLPVKGAGKFTGNFTNCVSQVKIILSPVQMDGENRVVIQKMEIKTKIGKGRLHLHNLFNGDKVLGDTINETINANFDAFGKEIIPLIEKALARQFKAVGNKIIDRYAEDQLFPL